MGIADNILNLVLRRSESSGLGNPTPWLVDFFGGGGVTASGKVINPETAKRVSAVYACVSILAETIAWLPLIVYKRQKDGGKERADSNPVYSILHDAPNDEMTPFEFREMMVGHLALRGNFYAYQVRDGGGILRSLMPLHPDRVRVCRNANQKIIYEYTPIYQGATVKYAKEEIYHVRGATTDGLCGDSIIKYMSESVGVAIAAEEFGARFFMNDATPSGGLETDKKLSDPAYARLKSSLREEHGGSRNAHKFMIFEEGLKWKQIGINANDAQLLELSSFTVRNIARFFRIPPHMIGDTDKQTTWGSGIEAMGIGFVQYTLMPWLARIEQASERDLLTELERKQIGRAHV